MTNFVEKTQNEENKFSDHGAVLDTTREKMKTKKVTLDEEDIQYDAPVNYSCSHESLDDRKKYFQNNLQFNCTLNFITSAEKG